MGIENFIAGYLEEKRPLKELGYYLRKEYKELSYKESIEILNEVLKTCGSLNLVLNYV